MYAMQCHFGLAHVSMHSIAECNHGMTHNAVARPPGCMCVCVRVREEHRRSACPLECEDLQAVMAHETINADAKELR